MKVEDKFLIGFVGGLLHAKGRRESEAYVNVPIAIAVMPQSQIYVNVEITETNAINPHLFLPNIDITFTDKAGKSALPVTSIPGHPGQMRSVS